MLIISCLMKRDTIISVIKWKILLDFSWLQTLTKDLILINLSNTLTTIHPFKNFSSVMMLKRLKENKYHNNILKLNNQLRNSKHSLRRINNNKRTVNGLVLIIEIVRLMINHGIANGNSKKLIINLMKNPIITLLITQISST